MSMQCRLRVCDVTDSQPSYFTCMNFVYQKEKCLKDDIFFDQRTRFQEESLTKEMESLLEMILS